VSTIAKRIEATPTLGLMAKTKSLTPAQNEHLREVLRELVEKDFSGNQSATAKALGVGQSLVSEVLAGGRGVGPKFIQNLADYTGRTIDELYGRAPLPRIHAGMEVIGRRHDWPAVREEAVAKARTVTAADIDRVAEVALSQPPDSLTVEFVLRLAEALLYAVPYSR
jgi:transcriptional regulator with XRE-family HTH domain